MGRIRTTLIKRTGKKLTTLYPDRFTADFTHNKSALKDVADIRSKKLRNVAAGYLATLIKRQQKK